MQCQVRLPSLPVALFFFFVATPRLVRGDLMHFPSNRRLLDCLWKALDRSPHCCILYCRPPLAVRDAGAVLSWPLRLGECKP